MDPQDSQGEQSLTMDQMQTLAPEYFSPQGMKIINETMNNAKQSKPELDAAMKMIAAIHGLNPNTDFESRLKQPDTLIRKIALHRKNGKEGYAIDNVNDVYGGRFIAKTPDQKKDLMNAVKELDKGLIKIDKIEHVQHGTYNAHHIDFTKGNVKGEIQVHDPHSLLESVANHPIRSKYGEKPPEPINQIKKQRTQYAYEMPAKAAQRTAQALEVLQKMGGV